MHTIHRGSRPKGAPLTPALFLAAAAGLSACALSPDATPAEQKKLAAAAATYEPPIEQRSLPQLGDSPTWRDVLERSFLANGDLEAAYFEWKAAVQRIDMAAAYPNSNLQLGYSYMFSAEKMKSFDRQTFSLGFSPSMMLEVPAKARQRGRVALDEARAAGERFRKAKFDLQSRVLGQWADLRMLENKLDVQQDQLALSRLAIDAIRARAQAGSVQRDLLRAESSLRTQESALEDTRAAIRSTRAMINGMLARDPEAPLDASHDPGRAFAASDEQVLNAAVELNPEIAALAGQTSARTDTLELARLRWIPDFNPSLMFTGSVSQAAELMISLPTTVAEIRGGIREAESMLRASEAMLRQTRSDRSATLVATLVALRNNERQATLFETTLIPLADRVLANTRQAYAAGSAMYLDLLDAQAMVLDARLMAIEAHAARDKRLAELEALMGTDIETLAASPAPQRTAADTTATAREESRHDR